MFRARSHCVKQNAKRCVFMTVAIEICTFEYGSHFHVTSSANATKTGSPTGVGVKIHANVNAIKRESGNTLFSSQKQQVVGC